MNDSELASMQMSLMLLTKRVAVLEQKETTRVYGPQNSITQGEVTNNGFVSLNKAGAMGEPQRTGVIGPDSNAKTIMEYRNFIEALLDLDCYALNVTEEVRNAARKVLGR